MKKAKIIGTIIGIFLFVCAIGGLTYAYTIWSSQSVNKQVSTKCFDVLYDNGTDLSGAIIPSYDYTGGLYTTVRLNISTKCNVKAKGILYLNTEEGTSSNLFRGGLLNYAIVRSKTQVIASGNITSTGEIEIDLGVLAKTENAFTRYDVYVWIDNDLVSNVDVNSIYYGSIRTEAIQYDQDYPSSNNYVKLTDHISNLYLNNKSKVVTNNNIQYQYSESVGLMNDRLGGTTSNYDDGNIRYYGSTPDNYVDIGDRDSSGNVIPYRIIGLFKDVELSNGTKKDLIKVIRSESIGEHSWDNKTSGIGSSVSDYGSNDWSDARLMMLLNPGYNGYNSSNPLLDESGDVLYGYEGSLWWNSRSGTCYSNQGPKMCDFTSVGLSSKAQNKIQAVIWNLGGRSDEYMGLFYADVFYKEERGTNVSSGRKTEWLGKIALMYSSDYEYAIDFNYCYDDTYDSSFECRSKNWLNMINAAEWTLSTDSDSFQLYAVEHNGNNFPTSGWVISDSDFDVRPSFYLNSNLRIMFGSGKNGDPYVLG